MISRKSNLKTQPLKNPIQYRQDKLISTKKYGRPTQANSDRFASARKYRSNIKKIKSTKTNYQPIII